MADSRRPGDKIRPRPPNGGLRPNPDTPRNVRLELKVHESSPFTRTSQLRHEQAA
jgi:hypothetical protein